MGLVSDRTFRGPIPFPVGHEPAIVLATRFSFLIPEFTMKFGAAKTAIDADWIKYRTELFTSICLPSVVHQARKPNLWALFASRTTEADLGPLKHAISPYPWIRIYWQETTGSEPQNFEEVQQAAMTDGAKIGSGNIISVRLDSDDALSEYFVDNAYSFAAAVRAGHPELDEFWMSFPIGTQLGREGLMLLVDATSHFHIRFQTGAAFEKSDRNGAFAINHRAILDKPSFFPLTHEPMWLEYAHGRNLVNSQKRHLPALSMRNERFREFHIDDVYMGRPEAKTMLGWLRGRLRR